MAVPAWRTVLRPAAVPGPGPLRSARLVPRRARPRAARVADVRHPFGHGQRLPRLPQFCRAKNAPSIRCDRAERRPDFTRRRRKWLVGGTVAITTDLQGTGSKIVIVLHTERRYRDTAAPVAFQVGVILFYDLYRDFSLEEKSDERAKEVS